eukprot:588932-Rhodomonas_salina.1
MVRAERTGYCQREPRAQAVSSQTCSESKRASVGGRASVPDLILLPPDEGEAAVVDDGAPDHEVQLGADEVQAVFEALADQALDPPLVAHQQLHAHVQRLQHGVLHHGVLTRGDSQLAFCKARGLDHACA